jgi:hypothetical protein
MLYDVVIPYHNKDASILPFAIQGVRLYAQGAQKIYVVSATDPEVEEAIWIPEDTLPIIKDDVSPYIHESSRVGWYYQQLLKLYAFVYLKTPHSHLLICDADLVLRKPIQFFKNGQICLALSDEYHEPYFTHMSRVLPELRRLISFSGVCHHMMMSREHTHELLTQIESRHGKPAWIVCLEQVDPTYHAGSGMSEYEIYFNYCLLHHADDYCVRPLVIDTFHKIQESSQSTADMVVIHAWT